MPKDATAARQAIGETANTSGQADSSKQAPPKAGVKFGAVVPKQGDLPEFIKPADLSTYERFTILKARKRYNQRFKHEEAVFDIAIKADFTGEGEEVRRFTVTFQDNEDRATIRALVEKHGLLVGCRLDKIATAGGDGNGYWKIVDADVPREASELADGGQPQLSDDDIPF